MDIRYKKLTSLYYEDQKEYESLYNKRINSESTYRFDFDIKGNKAFVVLCNDIVERIDKIYELDKILTILTGMLPGIAIDEYTKTCLIDEIKVTNEIEGVISTKKEIADMLNNKNSKNRLLGLVKKYAMLMVDSDLNLENCADIRSLYNDFVLSEVIASNKENAPDGKIFRKEEVLVLNEQRKEIHSGLLPEEKIIDQMDKCLKMLNNEDYNFLIRVPVFHYMFGYIHPFYDGNGRMSRYISSSMLSKRLSTLVSYRLACTIKYKKDSYYKMFKDTNDEKGKGDLTVFVIKFLDIIIESLKTLNVSLDERIKKMNYYKELVGTYCELKEDKCDTAFNLVLNSLFGTEGLSMELLCDILGMGKTKLRGILRKFEEDGILVKVRDGRIFRYSANLKALEDYKSQIEEK